MMATTSDRAAPPPPRQLRLARGDVTLAVRESGPTGAPTVVMVHGYPDTGATWGPVAALLEDRFHIVTYDVRGAGQSTRPAGVAAYRLDRLVADLAAVIDACSPHDPVHLVGHDWGAIAGWEALSSARLAGRVVSFTAISGPSLDQFGARLRAALRLRPRAIADVLSQTWRSWYIGVYQVPLLPALAWRLGLGYVARRAIPRLEGFAPRTTFPAPTLNLDAATGVRLYRANVPRRISRPRPALIDVPVQAIVGRRDPYVSPRLALRANRWVSTFYARSLDGRHWLQHTHPRQVATMIGELVDHVEGAPMGRALRRTAAHSDGGRFDGRLVVVTGAGSGIGRATARAFAAAGADVVAADIDLAAANQTVELAAGPGAMHAAHVDVSDPRAMEDFAAAVLRDHGVADIVVNNAGIGMAGSFLDTEVDDWRRVIDVNLFGVIHGARLFARQMVERGEGGQIVNLASMAAYTPSRTLPAYSTTKAAVLMLSECLRAELADRQIGVTAVCPGFIDTPITRRTRFLGVGDAEQERRRDASARLYRRRGFSAERVATEILDAAARNRPVVPVAPEASAGRLVSRLAPSLMRRLARLDVTPR